MNVLVATDGSQYGRWAVEWIARLPFKTKPRVRVLHVVDVAILGAPFMMQPVIVGTERYLQDQIRRLEKVAKTTRLESIRLLKRFRLRGKIIVDRGGVARSILKHATRGTALLSIGSRGLDALDRFMLGSISNHAIHRAPCPVLVVKEAPHPVKRIVLAIDGSRGSEKAIRFLCRNFQGTFNRSGHTTIYLTVVHVIPVQDYPEAGRMVIKRCVEMLSKSGFALNTLIQVGKPTSEILKIAGERKADLIVTGVKGLGAIRRMLLGSVSTRIVQHAACSVLVVR